MGPHEFATTLEGWHDFYLMVGTAAATMVGLLFVSLSFNLDVLLHDSRVHLMDLARQTFRTFLIALIIALIMLMPGLSIRVCGVELVAVGGIQFVMSLRNLVRLRHQRDTTLSRRLLIGRTMGPLLGGLIVMLVGYRLMRRDAETLILLSSATLMLIASGAWSAYDLLVRGAQARQR
jgi:modulator of FtsH protease